MPDPIYLDHNASTPVLPRVRDAAARALAEGFGNPSAGHVYGRRARAFVDRAREQVAALLGCDGDEVIFTSSGTEANNLAIRGFALAHAAPITVITSVVEHPAVVEPVRALGREGKVRFVRVAVDADGAARPEAFERALADATGGAVLVTLMLAQNETGVLQPVAEVARLARARGAVVHSDAAQAVGKVPVDVRALGVDLLSVAGHKLYAPKGVGALFVRRGTAISPVLVGAGHERGLRPGTENVSGIAALGEACAIASEDLVTEASRQQGLRDRLASRLGSGGFVVHAAGAARLPNTLSGRFPSVSGSALLAATPEISATTGSACHDGDEQASEALLAMGIPEADALGAIRLTLGRGTTADDIDRAADALLAALARV